jgi:hypothetical protein
MKILKIETLDKGWCDSDILLLHASFQILTNFVEKEKPFEVIDWNSDSTHKFIAKEIKSLYRWWKEIRPNRKDPLDDVPESEIPSIETDYRGVLISFDKKKYKKWHLACDKSCKLDVKWLNEDKKNLKRLIDIVEWLWT